MLKSTLLVLVGAIFGASAMFAVSWHEDFRAFQRRSDTERAIKRWGPRCEARKSVILNDIANAPPVTINLPTVELGFWLPAGMPRNAPIPETGKIDLMTEAHMCARIRAISQSDLIAAIEKRGMLLAELREKAIWNDVKRLMAEPTIAACVNRGGDATKCVDLFRAGGR